MRRGGEEVKAGPPKAGSRLPPSRSGAFVTLKMDQEPETPLPIWIAISQARGCEWRLIRLWVLTDKPSI